MTFCGLLGGREIWRPKKWIERGWMPEVSLPALACALEILTSRFFGSLPSAFMFFHSNLSFCRLFIPTVILLPYFFITSFHSCETVRTKFVHFELVNKPIREQNNVLYVGTFFVVWRTRNTRQLVRGVLTFVLRFWVSHTSVFRRELWFFRNHRCCELKLLPKIFYNCTICYILRFFY